MPSMKPLAVAVCAALVVACDQPPPTAPADDIEAAFAAAGHGPAQVSQRKIDNSLTPLALYPVDTDPTTPGPNKQNLAQTFTASRDGLLTYVYMPIACAAGVLVNIQIRDGGPTGALLFEANHDPATTVARGTFLTFQMGTGVPVTNGATYAIVLASVPGPNAVEETCSIIAGPLGDSYSGGEAYMNNPGFTPYWVPVMVQTSSGTFLMGDLPFVARIS